jgi:hypothetical protein
MEAGIYGMKIFLITTEIQNNGHEHSGYFLMRARNEASAQKKADRLCPHDGCGMDTAKSPVGYGDGLTSTEVHSVKPITPDEAETLERLNMAHYL